MPDFSLLVFFSFHELISSRELTHASSFRPGASGRSLFLFLTFLPRVNPLFPHLRRVLLHSSSSSCSVSLADLERRPRFSEPRSNKRGRYCYRIDTSLKQSGARTQKWKKIERSRRGNLSWSEETPGALCSARLLIAVNTIVLDDRDHVDNEITDGRYNRDSIKLAPRRSTPLMIDNS